MSANSFGNIFQITSFGESHGQALGCVIEGCPAGLSVDLQILSDELKRRRPGFSQSAIASSRNEADEPEILSGIFEGKTLGTPIAVIVRNQDAKSEDYQQIKTQARSGHADDVWKSKFGHSDYRGGGRSSGRETLSRVIGGAFAEMILRKLAPNLKVIAFNQQIGNWAVTEHEKSEFLKEATTGKTNVDSYVARFPSKSQSNLVEEALKKAKEAGDSLGAAVEVRVVGMPANLGQPVFHKLKSDFAQSFLSIGAVTGFQLGEGDPVSTSGIDFHTKSHSSVYGGIRGGISTGEDIIMKIFLKPTSSILDVAKKGRHDPCIAIRAIPVIEAMAKIVIADHLLWSRLDRILTD